MLYVPSQQISRQSYAVSGDGSYLLLHIIEGALSKLQREAARVCPGSPGGIELGNSDPGLLKIHVGDLRTMLPQAGNEKPPQAAPLALRGGTPGKDSGKDQSGVMCFHVERQG
jgi:hypothetical protein